MITTVRNAHFKKKRLRKKYRQGEFQELGFEIEAEWAKEFTDKEFDDAINLCIDLVEKFKMVCGGSMGPRGISLFVCRNKGKCTQEDIKNLKDAWEETKLMKNIIVSDLIDVWYGELPDAELH